MPEPGSEEGSHSCICSWTPLAHDGLEGEHSQLTHGARDPLNIAVVQLALWDSKICGCKKRLKVREQNCLMGSYQQLAEGVFEQLSGAALLWVTLLMV